MEIKYCFALLAFLVCANCTEIGSKDAFKSFLETLKDYQLTKEKWPALAEAIGRYPLHNMLHRELALMQMNTVDVCVLCNTLLTMVLVERRNGMGTDEIVNQATYFCSMFHIESRRVCEGLLRPNVEIIMHIIDENATLDSTRMCGLALSESHCDMGGNYQWSIDIPAGHTVEKPESTSTKTFNVMQITDLHVDLRYTEGKAASCNEPACCLYYQDDAKGSEKGCGHWGEYLHADTPLRTLKETLEFSQTQDFDYVYLTGDIISHRGWETSPESNAEQISMVLDMFAEHYKVPIYPIIGNHEPHPLNTFAPIGINDSKLSTDWLYKLVVEKWSKWLPMDEVKDTILKGGYYTVSPRPGFRIIVLNNNVFGNENWWLIHNDFDQYGQLQWLTKVLLEAEKNNERVHLLLHMPTGSTYTLPSWSRSFNLIVERFANTITGQFYGHSHKDELHVFYNKSHTNQAINVGWNGASVYPDKSNPSYKIYQIDDEVFDVVDFEEWTFNLTAANEKPDAALDWYQLYKFKESFGVKSLNAKDINDLVYKMAKNHDLIKLYHKFVYRNSDYALRQGCDNDCQKQLLCFMVKTEPNENRKCESLMKIYDENL